MSIDLQGDVVFEVDAIGWAPSGARTALSLHHELDPARLPAANKGAATVGGHERTPSGRYVLATGLADEEDGLCQAITPGALKPRVTYRVAGWISVSVAAAPGAGVGGTTTYHPVHVSIRVDDGRCVIDGGAVACSAAASESASHPRGRQHAALSSLQACICRTRPRLRALACPAAESRRVLLLDSLFGRPYRIVDYLLLAGLV